MSATPRKKSAKTPSAAPAGPQFYTLEVSLLGGMVTDDFVEKNPVVSRTIQMRGDQTLEVLHYAIFNAFGRDDEHMYEFQFGKRPMDAKAPRYVLRGEMDLELFEIQEPAGYVEETTLVDLKLKKRQSFFYWFDFGDDWWHEITVKAIDDTSAHKRFPKVIEKVGENPPQYPDFD